MSLAPLGLKTKSIHWSLILAAGFAVSCVTTPVDPSAQSESAEQTKQGIFQQAAKPTTPNVVQAPPSYAIQLARPTDWNFNGVEVVNREYDIPISNHSLVQHWIKYFTGRGKRHFQVYLKRSEFFIPYMRKILKEQGMPKDLVYLAMIESGFNNHARSRARAVGPWQFISATGKRYGLKVNWWVDERRDVKKSTEAAIRYLRDLYTMFGSWELAAASYNAGEAKVIRAMERYGSKNFWTLARGRYLKPETRNYVPKIMAAAILAKNRTQFGFEKTYLTAEEKEMLDKAPKDDLSQDAMLSEMLRRYETEESETGRRPAELVAISSSGLRDEIRSSAFHPIPYMGKAGVRSENVVEVEIDGPADLFKVAFAAGMTYEALKKLNPEILRWCTPPASNKYRVKIPLSSKEKFLGTYNHPEFPRDIQFQIYRVRKGDTLGRIARRFGIRVTPLKDLNGIRSARRGLVAGRKIKIPLPADRKASYAQLQIRDEIRTTRAAPKRSRKPVLKKRVRKVSYEERKAARSRRKNGKI